MTPCTASVTPTGCASPLGKLHNERTVPLHPMLVGLINDYRAWRGPTTTGLLVERNDHQPFDRRTIHRYVVAVGRRAGIGHVHPHALRHTLATQCINRGMSLEAIAALLGHRSPRMTLVYARISDTTVAEQYFTATRAVEADTAHTSHDPITHRRPTDELHRRLLGNGHCTRPLELDCRFQTICEGCGFYQTPVPSSSPSSAANATTPPPTPTRFAPRSTTNSSASSTTALSTDAPLDNQVTPWFHDPPEARKITRVTAHRGHARPRHPER